VALPPELTQLSLTDLCERRSIKWTRYPADVLPAWVAEMDFPLAPPVGEALRSSIDRGDVGYANPDASSLADELAGFAGRRMGWSIDPRQVITCNDVVVGLTDLLRVLTAPGDGVIINPPVYYPFFSLVAEAGRELVEVPLAGGRELDLAGIERAFAAGARALILCNPHNPTGRVAPRAELEELARIVADHDAWVLADEIHAPLTLPGAEHVPFVSASEEAAACGITLISASKTFNLAGLGCAQIVTAGEPARSAAGRLSDAARHAGHLGVLGAEAAFRDGDEWLDSVLAVLDANRQRLAELLSDRLGEVGYEPPQAGYLAWLDLSGLDLGADAAPLLLERGRVAVSGGPQFGTGGDGFIRLNVGTSPDLMEEVVERIAAAIDR